MRRHTILTAAALLLGCLAATAGIEAPDTTAAAQPQRHIYVLNTEPDSLTVEMPVKRRLIQRVDPSLSGPDNIAYIVEAPGDTAQVLLPRYDIGRYDRGLFNYLFVPRGQWAFGLTASYGEFDADDVQLLSILKDFDFNGKIYSLSPSVSYFFRNNQSIGLRFSYDRAIADLSTLAVDFDEDINFTLSDVSYYSQTYSLALFYRNYIGLSNLKRFGIFNEVELSCGSGSARFMRNYNSEPRDTRTVTTSVGLNFSPGVTMYIMDFVSFNVSFGVFGFHMTKESQTTNGTDEGDRFTSGANFKFNLFNIKFGVSVNI